MTIQRVLIAASFFFTAQAFANFGPIDFNAIMATNERVITCFTRDANWDAFNGSSSKKKRAKKKSLKKCQKGSAYPGSCQLVKCVEFTKKCVAKDGWGQRYKGFSPNVKRAKSKALNKCHSQSYYPASCKLKRCKVVKI